MNKQTKTLLGVAVVAGLGYYLWMQSKKNAAPKSFANFMSDETKKVPSCNGDYGKDANGLFICCKAGYRSEQSAGKPCGSVGQLTSVEESVSAVEF